MTLGPYLLAGMLLGPGADPATPNLAVSVDHAQTRSEIVSVEAKTPETKGSTAKSSGLPITPRSSKSRFVSRTSDESSSSPPAPSSRRMQWWISTAIGLIIVLTVIIVTGKALRKLVPGLADVDATGPIQLLYRTPLAPKQAVCLLRCGDRLLLVGLTSERMRTLAEITDPVEVDLIKGQCMQVRPNSTTRMFRDMFTRRSGEWREPGETDEEARDVAARTEADAGQPVASNQSTEFADRIDVARKKILAWKAKVRA